MKGYLVAAALGYIGGILWAPRKGELLRKEIKEHFCGLQQLGAEALENAELRGRQLVNTAVMPTVGQAKMEADYLKQEGTEIAQDLSKSANDAMDRGKTAFEASNARMKEKTTAAFSAVKDQAQEIKESGSEFLKNAKSALS